MEIKVFTIIFFILTKILLARVNIIVDNLNDSKVALSYLEGEKIFFVDSVISNTKENYQFDLKKIITVFIAYPLIIKNR